MPAVRISPTQREVILGLTEYRPGEWCPWYELELPAGPRMYPYSNARRVLHALTDKALIETSDQGVRLTLDGWVRAASLS